MSHAAPLKILFVASEVAPYSRTGGLSDVAGALPRALAGLGHSVLVVSPLYPSALAAGELANTGKSVTHAYPDGSETAGLVEAKGTRGARFVFLDHPGFYARPQLYGDGNGDYADNARRFHFLAAGALEAAHALGFEPDVVHAHDWHAGLAPLLAHPRRLRLSPAPARPHERSRPLTVFTVHNLAFHGAFPKRAVTELGLPKNLFTPEGFEFYGSLSFLKCGLLFADALTTVSPRYAREILTNEFGCGLEGVLAQRKDRLAGILNGIDEAAYDPSRDDSLPARFSAKDLSGKARCQKELARAFGLPPSGGPGPVFGLVARLTDQKGIDLVIEALPRFLESIGRLIVLGNGDRRYEEALRHAHDRFPTKLGVKIGFDERLARLVFAGSDLYLMPSRFEPCGLAQLYALRYGAVPVVRAVGGLDDAVVDVAADKKAGTGFKFEPYRADALLAAARRGAEAFANPKAFGEIVRRGMRQDFSWRKAAAAYETLYRRVLSSG